MTTIFQEREHTAEAHFVSAEEDRFDDRLRGVKALATWAAAACGRNGFFADAYRRKLLDLLVKGSSDEALLSKVMYDCPERERFRLEPFARTAFFRAVAARNGFS